MDEWTKKLFYMLRSVYIYAIGICLLLTILYYGIDSMDYGALLIIFTPQHETYLVLIGIATIIYFIFVIINMLTTKDF